MQLDAVLFDKDGTLFSFGETWNDWAINLIAELAAGDLTLARRIAEAVEFDLSAGAFLKTSPIIAGTNRQAAECIAQALPAYPLDDLETLLEQRSAEAQLFPPTDLTPLLTTLSGAGLRLGVMTNDSEFAALAQLRATGIDKQFHWVAGFDSGFGAKPAPTPLLAFARDQGVAPARTAMVGDSTHDLIAGRAAGMITVAVLTGMAGPEDLEPHADVILPHIGHLPDWIGLAPPSTSEEKL